MIRYAITIFLSAFLLFQVQPMIAKFILPWFGGTASVWTTCMLFFQVALLLGYCYSHFVTKQLTAKQQWVLHAILLVVALIFLPVQPSDVWKPDGSEDPTWQMLLLLGATIGFPFFLLSTTGPLIQAWQSKTHSDSSAYRLFAVSNFGSLLGLLGYPFLVEPYLRLGDQSLYWSIGFALFAGMCLWSAWQLFSHTETSVALTDDAGTETVGSSQADGDRRPQPSVFNCLMWTLLAFAASAILLATTNQMCQEVASVPFLWVLPLALYLLTFIICFENPRWYRRALFFPLMFVSVFLAVGLLNAGLSLPLPLQVAGYAVVMFACCMTCHGELAKAKPAESNLTLFFLMVSVGGALGGVFVVLVAPRIFDAYFEFQVSLIFSVALSVFALLIYKNLETDRALESERSTGSRKLWSKDLTWLSVPLAFATIAAIVVDVFEESTTLNRSAVLYRARNSYGTLHVRTDYDDKGQEESRNLINGRINHGGQLALGGNDTPFPISYYSATSGVGVAVDLLNKINRQSPLKFGVVGLGAGTMAAWGAEGDSFKFYEINPKVEYVAREFFTYLSDSRAADQIEVVIGDGRIQMETHFASHGSEEYDLLVVDAFSSDAIPMHLLTRECFKLYCDSISDNGILAIHVSNHYLQLDTIVYNLSKENDHRAFWIKTDKKSTNADMVEDFKKGADESSWVLVVRDPVLIDRIDKEANWSSWREPMPSTVWTDDFGSLTDVLDWSGTSSFAGEKWKDVKDYFSSGGEEEVQ